MAAPLSKKEAQRRIDAVEIALQEGYYPHGASVPPGCKSAVGVAAERLRLHTDMLREQVKPGGKFEQRLGLRVDWDLFADTPAGTPDEDPPVPARKHRDLELKCRRLELAAQQFSREKKVLQDQIISLQDTRAMIDGISQEIARPTIIAYKPKPRGRGGRHTAQVCISDVHCGAVVDADALSGLNSFNIEICAARIKRLRDKLLYLLLEHTVVKPDELVVLLMGDLISGGIFLHDEIGRSDEVPPPQQVRLVAEMLSGALGMWRKELKIPMRVICVPGNHGRVTPKNEPTCMADHSLDILACQFVEAAFEDDPGVRFEYPASGEAHYNIYNWGCLCLHGHNMGSGGGGGVYGPAYTMVRGGFKTRQSYAERGVRLHHIFIGHYHTTLRPTPFLHSNGSIIGPDAYAMIKLKTIPEPAQQNLHIFHDRHGIVSSKRLSVGAPDEGTIYDPERAPLFVQDVVGDVRALP